MDIKKLLNNLGIILVVAATVLGLLSSFHVIFLMIAAICAMCGAFIINKFNYRRTAWLLFFVVAFFSLIWNSWMLIDFIRRSESHLYYPILNIFFDLLIAGSGVYCLLCNLFYTKSQKEISPLFNYIDRREKEKYEKK